HLQSVAGLHTLNPSSTRVDVADDVAHELVRRLDLAAHHRLEQHRTGLLRRLLERHRAGDLEGDLARVDLVEAAVEELDPDVHHRVAGEHAALRRLADALLHRGDELLRDRSADDRVDELDALPRLAGREPDLHVPVLALAAGLADILRLGLGGAAHGLTVGDLGLAHVRLDL